MPALAKYTHFTKEITENDIDFLENDENQNYYQKQSSLLKFNCSENFFDNILHQHKILNL